jgi:cytochrome c peroxidase
MKRRFFVIGFLCVLLFAFRSADMFIDLPECFGKPVYDFKKSPLTYQRVELGRKLFYDPILSKNNQISCASCHSSYNAFAHIDHDLSHGIYDSIGKRNAPALMNLAWQSSFMWDGAVNHIEVQALAPISNPIEMDESLVNIVAKLQRAQPYPRLFFEAFGDSVITGERVLLSLAQFQLTLISCNSKYDSVMAGTSAFTAQEEIGYNLFRQNCASCHKEPLMSNYEFRNNGLKVDTTLNDYGRVVMTANPKDSLLFKVPTLRNIEYTYPYMHDGRFKTLNQVMNHYTSGIVMYPTLSPELKKPIVLSANDKIDLISFLLTLSDKSFVFNRNFAYPSPNNSSSAPKE